ncbi:MAG: DUF3309 family protein [Burkholderiales bacterium]
MSIGTILLIVLSVLLVAVVPDWRYARSWRYLTSDLLGVVLLRVPAFARGTVVARFRVR